MEFKWGALTSPPSISKWRVIIAVQIWISYIFHILNIAHKNRTLNFVFTLPNEIELLQLFYKFLIVTNRGRDIEENWNYDCLVSLKHVDETHKTEWYQMPKEGNWVGINVLLRKTFAFLLKLTQYYFQMILHTCFPIRWLARQRYFFFFVLGFFYLFTKWKFRIIKNFEGIA